MLTPPAAVLWDDSQRPPYMGSWQVVVEDLVLTPPQNRRVLVDVVAAGLCHSDLSVVDGNRPRRRRCSHMSAQELCARSGWSHRTDVGRPRRVSFLPSCGRCAPCQVGQPPLCRLATTTNMASLLSESTPFALGRHHGPSAPWRVPADRSTPLSRLGQRSSSIATWRPSRLSQSVIVVSLRSGGTLRPVVAPNLEQVDSRPVGVTAL